MPLSFDEIRAAVRTAVLATLPQGTSAYLSDVYDSTAVYAVEAEDGSVRYYQVGYEMSGQTVKVLGPAVEVERRTEWVVVRGPEFSAAHVSELPDGSVEIVTRLFELGDYPDKGFSLNEEEADDAVAAVNEQGAGVEIEHQRSVFTRADRFGVGRLVKAWRDGRALFGVVRFQPWVRQALKGEQPSVSLGFTAQPKRIREVSLVLSPRIESAGLLAAFAEASAGPRRGPVGMDLLTNIRNLLRGAPPDQQRQAVKAVAAEFDAAPQAEPSVSMSEIEQIVQREIAAFRSELAHVASQGTADQVARAVADFRAEAVASRRATPAAADALAKAYEAALLADGGGRVTFSHGRVVEGPAAQAVRAALAAMPKLAFTEEAVKEGALFVLDPSAPVESDGYAPITPGVLPEGAKG